MKKYIKLLSIISVFTFLFISCESPFFGKAAGVFEITFETNGGTEIESLKSNKIIKSPVTTKQNCDFVGWFTNPSFQGEAVLFPYVISETQTLYAKWNQKYQVSFESNGGTTVNSILTSNIDYIISPTKQDCTFAGWYINPDFSGGAIEFPFTPTRDMTLYARWNQKYYVTYNTNGGNDIEGEKVSILTSLPVPLKIYSEFAGWFTNPSLTGNAIQVPFEIKSDTILYAKWIPTYEVSFDTNGGSIITSFRARKIEELNVPERSGYTFVGWYIDSTLKSPVTYPMDLTSDITLYAKWQQNFAVSFETNGGTLVSAMTTGYIEEVPVTSKTDCFFDGWYTDPEFNSGSKVSFPLTLTGNMILYAKWLEQQVSITYMPNGATSGTVPETIHVAKGASVTISSNVGNLEKTGYAFTKWFTSTDGKSGQGYSAGQTITLTKNLVLYAQWGKDYGAMVLVEGGTYVFGDITEPESSRPKITLDGFYMAKYELTYELYLEVYTWAIEHGYTLDKMKKGYSTNDQYKSFIPATFFDFEDACVWLNAYSEYKGLEPVYYKSNVIMRDTNSGPVNWNRTKNGFRLPTEAEWEYAAKGGPAQKNYKYPGSNTLSDVAWYYSNSGGDYHAVGTKSPNTLGIYDLVGNAAEYCWDYYSTFGTGDLINPIHNSGAYRCVRGGSFNKNLSSYYNLNMALYARGYLQSCRSALYDDYYYDRCSYYELGIRIARNAD